MSCGGKTGEGNAGILWKAVFNSNREESKLLVATNLVKNRNLTNYKFKINQLLDSVLHGREVIKAFSCFDSVIRNLGLVQ